MDTSIPALFSSRCNALKTICSRIERESTSDTELLQISRWQDELGRLRLWAANIGVHRTDQSSLEFRLKDSSHISQQVTNLLLDLGQIFQEVEDLLDLLADGHDSQVEVDDASDDDYDTGEDLTQLHSNIVTVINCLFQMSMLVRRPALHDFYMLPQSQEVLAFRPSDQTHVRERYPEADQGLVERLGLAITLRRQYFRYRERHHAKLSQGLDVGTEGSTPPTVVLSDTIVTGVESRHIDVQDKAPDSEKSQISYAPSMPAGGALRIPSPPKESSGGAPFECPYCFVIISVDGVSAWQKHVFQDLQPYICTVVACSTPHTLFSTEYEWVQHLKEVHPREWTGDEYRAAAAINEPNESNFCAICPLCKSILVSEKDFVHHLARHLRELALFVLPQDKTDSDIDDGPGSELLEKSNLESAVSSTSSTNPEHEDSHDEQQVHDRQSDRDLVEPRRDSRFEPRDDHKRRFSGIRQHRPRLNEFFVDGTRIHREVMQREICKFLGPEAYSKPHSYNGIQGYLVSAVRPFTPDQLDDLQGLSEAYESENGQMKKRGYPGIPYENSEVARRKDANLKHSDDTNRYYTGRTPYGSKWNPGMKEELRGLSRFSAADTFPWSYYGPTYDPRPTSYGTIMDRETMYQQPQGFNPYSTADTGAVSAQAPTDPRRDPLYSSMKDRETMYQQPPGFSPYEYGPWTADTGAGSANAPTSSRLEAPNRSSDTAR